MNEEMINFLITQTLKEDLVNLWINHWDSIEKHKNNYKSFEEYLIDCFKTKTKFELDFLTKNNIIEINFGKKYGTYKKWEL